MSEQLALWSGFDDAQSFENFFTISSNRLLVNQLKHQASGSGEQWVFVHGAEESGRSHLLQASCRAGGIEGLSVAYLPLKELQHYEPSDVLSGIEVLDLVCIDDIHLVMGDLVWEEALFHLYNRLKMSGTSLLVSSRDVVSELPCKLGDLFSRLSGFSVYKLHGLGDEERVEALVFRARDLGFSLDTQVAEYIYHRVSREPSALFKVLSVLDRESLRHKRIITKHFVKMVMGW